MPQKILRFHDMINRLMLFRKVISLFLGELYEINKCTVQPNAQISNIKSGGTYGSYYTSHD
jgi:hypothetical protein